MESKWKNYHIIIFPGWSLSKNRDIIYARCFLWRQNYPEVKLLPQSDLWGRVFLEKMSCRHYDKKKCEHHSYKIGTWNVRTLNQGGKLENLKAEMRKNEVSVLGVSEVRWKDKVK